MASPIVCPQCGATRPVGTAPCAKCGADAPGLPTALIQTPNPPEPSGLPTAMVQTPNAPEPAGLPTAMIQTPNAPDRAPFAPTALSPKNVPALPTEIVQSPNAPAPRSSAPKKPLPDAARTMQAKAPFPLSEPDAHAPTHMVPISARDEAPAVDTNKVEAPFPVEPAPVPESARQTREAPAKKAAPIITRDAPKLPADTNDDAVEDTGRVVAPYRNAKPDVKTGKVAVPFRAVEAPFAVEEKGEPEPSNPSVPMAVAKRKGATQEYQEQPEAGVGIHPVAAPFPIGQTPPKAQPAPPVESKVKLLFVAAGVALMVATVGVAAAVIIQSGPKSAPKRGSPITDVSAKHRVRPGFVRVTARCGAKEIPAQVTVANQNKGTTPVELALQTSQPPGDYTLELHLTARFGKPVDAVFQYSLPLDPSNGIAIEVELDGCVPQQFGE